LGYADVVNPPDDLMFDIIEFGVSSLEFPVGDAGIVSKELLKERPVKPLVQCVKIYECHIHKAGKPHRIDFGADFFCHLFVFKKIFRIFEELESLGQFLLVIIYDVPQHVNFIGLQYIVGSYYI